MSCELTYSRLEVDTIELSDGEGDEGMDGGSEPQWTSFRAGVVMVGGNTCSREFDDGNSQT